MSTTKGPPQKTITDLNNEVKKYLWAAFQNKKKIIKLAEITMTYLNKAKKIKNEGRCYPPPSRGNQGSQR